MHFLWLAFPFFQQNVTRSKGCRLKDTNPPFQSEIQERLKWSVQNATNFFVDIYTFLQ
jgi:hypothetical protein